MTDKSIPYRVGYRITGYVLTVYGAWQQFWKGVDDQAEPKTPEPKYTYCEGCNREGECRLDGKCLGPNPERIYCPHCAPHREREYRVQDGRCIQCGAAR